VHGLAQETLLAALADERIVELGLQLLEVTLEAVELAGGLLRGEALVVDRLDPLAVPFSPPAIRMFAAWMARDPKITPSAALRWPGRGP
jgi:hypothetical protein